jgi:NADPH:quinone reductase-like Zn-dependent oxidoreductase
MVVDVAQAVRLPLLRSSIPIGVSLRGGKEISQVLARVTARDLELLSDLTEAGKVRPQIDRRYPFAEIPAAIAYLEQGHARGKVVVAVA